MLKKVVGAPDRIAENGFAMHLRNPSGYKTVSRWLLPQAMLLICVLFLGWNTAGLTEYLQRTTFDSYQRLSPRPYQPTPVRVVLVGPAGTARVGPWPWPQDKTIQLLQALAAEGAKAVIIADTNADTENAMAAVPLYTVAGAGLSAPRDKKARTEQTFFTPVPRVGLIRWQGRLAPFGEIPDYTRLHAPRGAKLIGVKELFADSDGVIRQAPIALRWQGQPVPSLAAQSWRLMTDATDLTLHSDDGAGRTDGRVGLRSASTGSGETGLTREGGFRLAFAQNHPARWSVPALTALNRSVTPGSLRDTVIFIGSENDTVFTPLGEKPRAFVQAEAAENLLLGTALTRPGYMTYGELLALLIIGSVTAFLFARYGLALALPFGGLMILLATGTGWLLYGQQRVLYDPLSLSVGMILIMTVFGGVEIWEWARRRRNIIITFGGKLPTGKIRMLMHQQDFSYAPMPRTIAYMSCGWREVRVADGDRDAFIRSRTEAITIMADTILRNGGMLDAVTGDEMTAVWNVPLDDPEPARHCCQAAIALQTVVDELNKSYGERTKPIAFSIGLSAGEAIAAGFTSPVGTMGYSVGGRCVRHAKILRQSARNYGYPILAGESVQNKASDSFAFLEVDTLILPHADGPTRLYALAGDRALRANPRLRAQATFHNEIFAAIRARQWAKARTLIGLCRKLSGASDTLYDLHLARIQELEKNPPDADWDGAFRLTMF